jgi:TRAP-type C4-dicarboxylate transport system permease small subunit
MKWHSGILRSLQWVLHVVGGGSLIFITVLGFIEVVGRYVFGVSHDWAEELLRYGFILGVYLLGGMLIRREEHLSFTLFSAKLGERGKRIHSLVVNGIGFVLSIFICYWSIDMIKTAARLGLKGSSFLFPLKYVYLMVPVGIGFYALFSLLEMIKTIQRR